ncbi:MAG: S8 family serine peptidase [Pseudonocardiales bacterium]
MSSPRCRAVRLAAVGVVLALTTAVPLLTATPALAVCRQPPPLGALVPADVARDPVLARLGLERVWEITKGRDVTVSVVDSGVDATHPTLAPAMVAGISFTTVDNPQIFESTPGGIEDCENHGTSVAGLIAARPGVDERMAGVAPEATIAPVSFGSIGQAPDVMLAEAIRAGARLGRVVNLSFAVSGNRPEIQAAIEFAIERDVVVVAAAGNEGQSQPGETWYPAAYDGVLAVTAVGPTNEPLQEANTGEWIDVAAPGQNLIAPATGGGELTYVSGTSFATALVSGVAALVRARFPELSAPAVIERIRRTAVPVAGSANEKVGVGLVDPLAALTARTAGSAPSAQPTAGGDVAVQPRPVERHPLDGLHGALAWTGGLVAIAALSLVGGIAARAARRRGGQPTPDPTTGQHPVRGAAPGRDLS